MGTFQVLMMIVAFIMFGLFANIQMSNNAAQIQRQSESETIDNMYSIYKMANQNYDSLLTYVNWDAPFYLKHFPYGHIDTVWQPYNLKSIQIRAQDLSGQIWICDFDRTTSFQVVKL